MSETARVSKRRWLTLPHAPCRAREPNRRAGGASSGEYSSASGIREDDAQRRAARGDLVLVAADGRVFYACVLGHETFGRFRVAPAGPRVWRSRARS